MTPKSCAGCRFWVRPRNNLGRVLSGPNDWGTCEVIGPPEVMQMKQPTHSAHCEVGYLHTRGNFYCPLWEMLPPRKETHG